MFVLHLFFWLPAYNEDIMTECPTAILDHEVTVKIKGLVKQINRSMGP